LAQGRAFMVYPLKTAASGQVLSRAGTRAMVLPLLVSGAIEIVHPGHFDPPV